MNARTASDRGSTGAAETSRFQTSSAGNMGQPASVGPAGAGGVPASGAPASCPGGDGAGDGLVSGDPPASEPPHAAEASRKARTVRGIRCWTPASYGGFPRGLGERSDESRHRLQHRRLALLVRSVPGSGDQQRLHRSPEATLQSVDLRDRPVLVLLALDEQGGRTDGRQRALEVPLPEGRVEPGSVPAPERRIHVPVVFRQARAQIAVQVSLAGSRNAAQAVLLGEYVGRL